MISCSLEAKEKIQHLVRIRTRIDFLEHATMIAAKWKDSGYMSDIWMETLHCEWYQTVGNRKLVREESRVVPLTWSLQA
jgi:uncharacterized protein YodC (DUF2158 family)